MASYTTIQGDTWDGISMKTLGSEYYMGDIIDANPEHRETVVFSANITLAIPDVTTAESLNLPPWKRGEA